jgi:signal transduction histidine kinase
MRGPRSATLAQKKTFFVLFAALLAVGVALGLMGTIQLSRMSARMDRVLTRYAANALEVERLNTASERLGRGARSFVLTGDARFLVELRVARAAFGESLARLRAGLPEESERQMLDAIEDLEEEHERAVDDVVRLRQAAPGLPGPAAIEALEGEVQPARDRLNAALAIVSANQEAAFEEAVARAQERGRAALQILGGATLLAILLAGGLGWRLARTLGRLERNRRELERSLELLGQANRDLDAFAGRIAHDLRNLLAPLGLVAGRLKRPTLPPADVEGCAARIDGIVQRADGLIEGLLAFARAGRGPEASAQASLGSVLGEVLADLEPARAEVDAAVVVSPAEALAPLEVRCAPSLLYVVLVNLVGNALKFLAGSPRREVRITARAVDAGVELVVEDTGPGIPPAALGRIFQPFYRAPDARAPGTGIGLATVQRIVEAHGGTIAVASAVGTGTRFSLRLPIGVPRREPAGAVREALAAAHP